MQDWLYRRCRQIDVAFESWRYRHPDWRRWAFYIDVASLAAYLVAAWVFRGLWSGWAWLAIAVARVAVTGVQQGWWLRGDDDDEEED